MKQLYILRHAKAASEDLYHEDKLRPLNDRGREAAGRLGLHLEEDGIRPTLIYCSASVRTRETLELLLPHLPKEAEVRYEQSLYLASAGTLLALVNGLPEEADSVMIVGHNPGMHVIALELAGNGPAPLRRQLRENFPTAAMASLSFKARWKDIRPEDGTLTAYLTPKTL